MRDLLNWYLFRVCWQLCTPSSVQNLLKAVEEENVDGFTEALRDFDSISRLDKNLTAMLLKVKKQLNAEPDLC